MGQPLPRLSELFLGDDHARRHADPAGDPAAWISPVSPDRAPRAIRLIGLVWILVLGLAAIAGRIEAREEVSHPGGPVRVAQVQRGLPVHMRLRSGANHRSHKHPLPILRVVPSCDSSDDDATEDYDDDDAWDDPNGSDDSGAPIIAGLRQIVPSLIAPKSQSAATCSETPFPLFLTLQRLRC
jgi:hypothetical protein